MKRELGFTLLELMAVVAIVAILALFAMNSYKEAIHKSHRAEGIQALSDLALRQEKWRANNTTYGTCLQAMGPSTCVAMNGKLSYYTVAVTANTAGGFTMTAVPKGAQVGDRCGTYTFTMANGVLTKTAASGQTGCL